MLPNLGATSPRFVHCTNIVHTRTARGSKAHQTRQGLSEFTFATKARTLGSTCGSTARRHAGADARGPATCRRNRLK